MANRFTQKAQEQSTQSNVVKMPNTSDLPDWYEEKKGRIEISYYNLAQHVRAKYPAMADTMEFVIYNPKLGYWTSNTETFLNRVVSNEFLKKERKNNMIKEVENSILAQVTTDETKQLPRPIVGKVALKNGVYDMKTGKFDENGFKPEFYLRTAHDIEYDETATCDAFDKFLMYINNDDDGKVRFVYEWLGSLFWTDLRSKFMQKILFVYGNGGSGKSVITQVARALVGEAATVDVEIGELKPKNFGTDVLHNASLAVDADTAITAVTDTTILRKLSGNDAISSKRKFRSNVTFRTYVKLIVLFNKMFHILDENGEIRRRAILLSIFSDVDDRKAEEKGFHVDHDILPELSGIFNKAVKSFMEAYERGSYTITDEMEQEKELWLDGNDKVIQFVNDALEQDMIYKRKDGEIEAKELYNRFLVWNQLSDNKNGGMKQTEFYRRVENMGYIRKKSSNTLDVYDKPTLENIYIHKETSAKKTHPTKKARPWVFVGLSNKPS